MDSELCVWLSMCPEGYTIIDTATIDGESFIIRKNIDAKDDGKEFRPIHGTDDVDIINKAIKVPEMMLTEGGRRIEIVDWCPRVILEDVIRVDIKAIIKMNLKPFDKWENNV